METLRYYKKCDNQQFYVRFIEKEQNFMSKNRKMLYAKKGDIVIEGIDSNQKGNNIFSLIDKTTLEKDYQRINYIKKSFKEFIDEELRDENIEYQDSHKK